ncbi:conserved Plasmodium protein, unknown function [Plasmodium gallinaceum]|uniref:Uncharacterized protein n=1 Tax=Plasmodium gallinaceum TaxID=5849 RepID=A0A1J1GRZ7_PLAGA|nr:conserved Plasmodium protein, unknown function [Plasmodium gallinaceum]CRG95076.1 conserved Plasmodium protein, unknown function [Plasmodium gallinaceum]
MWHRGVLTLLCNSCRYVIRKWHIPLLGIDCNANPRHKQVLSNPSPRSRGIPKYLEKYIFYKQSVRNPKYKSQFITMYTAGRKYRQQIKKTA